jgi:hypothetical protein
MLAWMRRSMGGKGRGGMGSVLGAMDDVFNPGAASARETLQAENQRVVTKPSPGDKLLKDGKVVIQQPSGRSAKGSH